MRDVFCDVGLMVGVALMVIGTWSINQSVGLIVSGIVLCAISIMAVMVYRHDTKSHR